MQGDILRLCATYEQIFKLFHAIVKNSIGRTILRLQTKGQTDRQTDRLIIIYPPKRRLPDYRGKKIVIKIDSQIIYLKGWGGL